MLKIKAIMKTANEAVEELRDENGLNVTEINHLIYAAATPGMKLWQLEH